MLKVQIGKVQLQQGKSSIYINKTRKYLFPLIKEYGATFLKLVNDVYKVAVGVGDFVVKNREISYEKHLFLLVDFDVATHHFIKFLNYVREHPAYEDDYVFGNIQKTSLHMVILKLPEKFNGVLTPFKHGQYSEMFSQENIDLYFSDKPNIKAVLVKDHNYKVTFVTKKLNRIYNSDVKPEEWTGELDLPPREEEENFNHHLKKK
jgi:hypothetical protein